MFLMAIIEYLVSNGVGVFGTDLFGSSYPATAPNKCVVVRDNGGPPPSKHLPVEEYTIQFLSRDISYPDAYAKAVAIFELFHAKVTGDKWDSKHNYLIGAYYVRVSKALQRPSDISPDDKGRSEVSFNIAFEVRKS